MAKKKKENPVYSASEKRQYERIAKLEKLKSKLLAEMKKDSRYDSFFSQYRADTVETFKEDFCMMKAELIVDGPWYFKQKQDTELHFHEHTENLLWHIQQKKLFDLQCLWRAEKIQINEIVACVDFEVWSEDIKRCTFIPIITEDEIELLQQYVLSHSYDEPLFFRSSWHDYPQFKKEHTGDEQTLSMPEWYHFYNMHRGTESLMLLPDVRGAKEEVYIRAGLNELQKPGTTEKNFHPEKKRKKKIRKEDEDPDDPEPFKGSPITAPNDTRPWLSPHAKDKFSDFIKQFEGPELKKIHEIRQRLNEKNIDSFRYLEFEDALDTLRMAGDHYPMEPYFMWREGVFRLAQKFKQEKMAEALPVVFEEYLFKAENGIEPFITKQDNKMIEDIREHASYMKHWILLGRKVLGEPQNFDF